MDSSDFVGVLDLWDEPDWRNPEGRQKRNQQEKRNNKLSNRHTWKHLVKATIRGDVDMVRELLLESRAWHDMQLPGALKAAESEEMLQVFAEAAPGFFWDYGAKLALLSAADEGRERALNSLLAFGVSADATSPSANVAALHAACMKGYVACARLLLEHGADASMKVDRRLTPLHFAAAVGSLECVEVLLLFGADVSSEDDMGRQALHWAAACGSAAIARALVARGADPNALDSSGQTPFLIAARGTNDFWHELPRVNGKTPTRPEINDYLECLKELVRLRANVNAVTDMEHDTLFVAITYRAYNIFHYLLQGIVDLSYRTRVGETALHWAVGSWSKVFLQHLVDAGVDVNCRRNDGKTPLHITIEMGFIECVQELIRLGADVLQQDDNGYSAIHYVARHQRQKIMRLVLDAGGDVTLRDNDGASALHHVCYFSGDLGLLKELLDRGADPNARTTDGRTPLHFAARLRTGCLEELLARGGDVTARDLRGWTVLHHAANDIYARIDHIFTFLVERGLHVATRAYDGKTPLHVAARSEAVRALLSLKAPVNARDDAGRTPLHEAGLGGNASAAEELLMGGAHRTARDNEGRTPVDLTISPNVREIILYWALGA